MRVLYTINKQSVLADFGLAALIVLVAIVTIFIVYSMTEEKEARVSIIKGIAVGLGIIASISLLYVMSNYRSYDRYVVEITDKTISTDYRIEDQLSDTIFVVRKAVEESDK